MLALVTDVGDRIGVAGMRALAHGGVGVIALAPSRGAAGLWSRHPVARLTGPDPLTDPSALVERIGEIARERGPLVAYPVLEESLTAALTLPLPPEAILPLDPASALRLADKREFASLAAAAGLAVPRGVTVEGPEALSGASPEPPWVVKPALPGGGFKAQRASSAAEVRDLIDAGAIPAGAPLVVQQHVEGALIGLALVLDREGRVVARFQQIADAVWPPGAGGSRIACSVPPDDALVERAATLLRAAGYHGLAHVQLIDGSAGPVALEANTRFYGSMPLALASGVNLAAAWHAVASGAAPPPERPYRVGVRYRWMEAAVMAAARGDRAGLLSRPRRGRAGAIWASDDPVPGALLALGAVTGRLRR